MRWCLLFFVLLSPLLCATRARSSDPKRLLADADRLAFLYNWPKAGPLYAEAQTLFTQSGDRKGALSAKLGLIRAQVETGTIPELDTEVARDMQSPLVRGDPRLMLRCLTTKAALDQEINEASARDVWGRVLALAKSTGDRRWQARAQAELGIITFLDGDVANSSQMLKTALIDAVISRDFGAIITYGSIVGNGQVEVGQPEAGLTVCNITLKLAAITRDMGFPFMAYEGKARALIALHREADAKKVLDQAVAQARTQGAHAAEAQLLVVMGKQAAASDPKRAIEYLKAATTLCETSGFRHVLAWSTLELAKIYRDTGDLKDAEKSGMESLNAMREVEDKYHLPFHLVLLADLEAKGGKFAQADELYEQATDVVEGLLANVSSRQVESSLIATESLLYLGHFRVAATNLHNVTKAYQILERARGRSIADALRNEPMNVGDRDSTIQAAQKEVTRIQLSLLRETAPNERRKLLDRLFEAEQVLAPVGNPNSPMQHAATHGEPVDLTKLRRSLRPDEMILEYVLDEPKSFCLRITRSSAGVSVLPAGRKRIEDLVQNYLAEIQLRRGSTKSGGELYSLLLRPIPGANSKLRLIVVPGGALHLLPLDSLTDLEGRYILSSHIVTYAPSATVLYLLRNFHSTHQPTMRFLGVGGVHYGQAPFVLPVKSNGSTPLQSKFSTDFFAPARVTLSNLPGSQREVVSVAEVVGEQHKLLLGDAATEAAFKSQRLAEFRIIHLAVHGIANTQFPDRAALVLGSTPALVEDGLLQVREIRDLPLAADMVTLSACETGQGKLLGEEGIASLERAFLVAGAKAVLASLWTSDDTYTTTLMKHLYRHLADGEDKGSALRDAKIDLLEEFGNQAVPFYWAGFTLVGEGSTAVFN